MSAAETFYKIYFVENSKSFRDKDIVREGFLLLYISSCNCQSVTSISKKKQYWPKLNQKTTWSKIKWQIKHVQQRAEKKCLAIDLLLFRRRHELSKLLYRSQFQTNMKIIMFVQNLGEKLPGNLCQFVAISLKQNWFEDLS